MSVAPPYSRLHAVELPEADAPLIRDLMLAGVASCTATRRDTDTSPYRVDLETVDSLRRELTTTHRVIAAFDGDIPVGVVRLPIADEDGLLRFERLSQVPGYPPKAACEFLVDRVYEEARNLG
ncbi:MAG: hypothetical protein Q4G40_08755, partial [Brachybacterium sp.]|nr:hypothetical protein [Brachybacterium sp.]